MSSDSRTITDGPSLEQEENITVSSSGPNFVEEDAGAFRRFSDVREGESEFPFPQLLSADSDEQSTTLVGEDSRVRVANASKYPYSCVAALWIDIGPGKPYLHGTGVLVSPNLVLTAGHNLYNFLGRRGNRASGVHVYFALNGKSTQATRVYVSNKNFITIREWADDRNKGFDYAGIILPTKVGSRFGWMSLQARGEGDYHIAVNNLGYPLDCPKGAANQCPQPGTTQWHDQGRILEVEPNTLAHTIDTAGGVSGGPIFSYHPGTKNRYRVVGLHTRGLADPTRNLAVRVTSTVVKDICFWASKYGGNEICN